MIIWIFFNALLLFDTALKSIYGDFTPCIQHKQNNKHHFLKLGLFLQFDIAIDLLLCCYTVLLLCCYTVMQFE